MGGKSSKVSKKKSKKGGEEEAATNGEQATQEQPTSTQVENGESVENKVEGSNGTAAKLENGEATANGDVKPEEEADKKTETVEESAKEEAKTEEAPAAAEEATPEPAKEEAPVTEEPAKTEEAAPAEQSKPEEAEEKKEEAVEEVKEEEKEASKEEVKEEVKEEEKEEVKEEKEEAKEEETAAEEEKQPEPEPAPEPEVPVEEAPTPVAEEDKATTEAGPAEVVADTPSSEQVQTTTRKIPKLAQTVNKARGILHFSRDKEGSQSLNEESAPATPSESAETGAAVASSEQAPEVAAPSQESPATVKTEFKWENGGEKVLVSGSFNSWQENVALSKEGDIFIGSMDIPVGEHLYKFMVDEQWMVNKNLPIKAGEDGVENNVVMVS